MKNILKFFGIESINSILIDSIKTLQTGQQTERYKSKTNETNEQMKDTCLVHQLVGA